MTIKVMLRVYSVAALVLLVFIGLGPAKWVPRSIGALQTAELEKWWPVTASACFTRLVIEEIPFEPGAGSATASSSC